MALIADRATCAAFEISDMTVLATTAFISRLLILVDKCLSAVSIRSAEEKD